MKIVILFSFFVLPLFSNATNILHKHLTFLYERDPARCLELSKNYMNWFSQNASPYYFASKIYFDKTTQSNTPQGQYRNLSKSIGYAIQFEERADEQFIEEVGWKGTRSKLEEKSEGLILTLDDMNETNLSHRLLSTFEKFSPDFDIKIKSRGNEIYEIANRVENASYEFNSTHTMFGMPTGQEQIPVLDENEVLMLLELINSERKKKGLEKLQLDDDLSRACRYHTFDLATQKYFNHDSYDRIDGQLKFVGTTFDRIGQFYHKSTVTSENIAAGNYDAMGTYNQWHTSKGHYTNMMDSESTRIGIGMYYSEDSPFGYYWSMCTAK